MRPGQNALSGMMHQPDMGVDLLCVHLWATIGYLNQLSDMLKIWDPTMADLQLPNTHPPTPPMHQPRTACAELQLCMLAALPAGAEHP